MEFRTKVEVAEPPFRIEPRERMLFVGSCFAEGIGQRFREEQFRAVVNPYGVMYNPVSVLHTVEHWLDEQVVRGSEVPPRVVFLTLGTNHVYRLKETGEIVDNCGKRPQRLFREEQLSVGECCDALSRAVGLLRRHRLDVHVVLTVSPIRYRKYGFHGSWLSKSVLLLSVERLLAGDNGASAEPSTLSYFPAFEIVLDELRDYRFYKPDMVHPSEQAVDYVWQQLAEHYLSADARQFVQEWAPVKAALAHRPFNAESAEYQQFLAATRQKAAELLARYESF